MDTTLADLLERNRAHVESLESDHFEDVQDGQRPALVSVCCSDSRVSQEGMWSASAAEGPPGVLFTAGNVGNQVWDVDGGERVVNGDVLYPLWYADTDVAAVVGHTGCGAVTATLEAVEDDGVDAADHPEGVRRRIESLRPVVEDGLADDRVDTEGPVGTVDQLVEYNVDRQVAFLRESDDVPDSTTVFGFVYDFQRVYGDVPGRCYLVNADGETGVDGLRERVPEGFEEHVRRLL